jgi:hypothetical protein
LKLDSKTELLAGPGGTQVYFRKLRQENHKFDASLGYREKPCLKNQKKRERQILTYSK